MGAKRSQLWLRRSVLAIPVPDPGGAGVLMTNYVLFKAPNDLTIKKLWHVPNAAWVAAAAVNDGVVIFKRNNTGVVVATLSVVTNLAVGTMNDCGAIAATGVLSETDNLTEDTGAALGAGTGNGPASTTVVEFEYNEAP